MSSETSKTLWHIQKFVVKYASFVELQILLLLIFEFNLFVKYIYSFLFMALHFKYLLISEFSTAGNFLLHYYHVNWEGGLPEI